MWSGDWAPGVRIWPRATLKTPENPGHLSGGGDMGDAIEEKGHHQCTTLLLQTNTGSNQCPSPSFRFRRNEMNRRPTSATQKKKKKRYQRSGFSR